VSHRAVYSLAIFQHLLDYPVAIWAAHRLGAIVSCVYTVSSTHHTPHELSRSFCKNSTANPAYTSEELEYQLSTIKASIILAHAMFLPAALDAARLAGISPHRVVVVGARPQGFMEKTLDELVGIGLAYPANYTERRLRSGEARSKIALLCFSSGTTGKPKVSTCVIFVCAADT
jgi:4-coumarate--CoA ligase